MKPNTVDRIGNALILIDEQKRKALLKENTWVLPNVTSRNQILFDHTVTLQQYRRMWDSVKPFAKPPVAVRISINTLGSMLSRNEFYKKLLIKGRFRKVYARSV